MLHSLIFDVLKEVVDLYRGRVKEKEIIGHRAKAQRHRWQKGRTEGAGPFGAGQQVFLPTLIAERLRQVVPSIAGNVGMLNI